MESLCFCWWLYFWNQTFSTPAYPTLLKGCSWTHSDSPLTPPCRRHHGRGEWQASLCFWPGQPRMVLGTLPPWLPASLILNRYSRICFEERTQESSTWEVSFRSPQFCLGVASLAHLYRIPPQNHSRSRSPSTLSYFFCSWSLHVQS